MSLSLLNNNRYKPWLNPRVNNLRIDGRPTFASPLKLYVLQQVSNQLLDAGAGIYKTIFSANNVKTDTTQGTRYEVSVCGDLQFNKTGGSNCRLRMVIEDIQGNTLYTGSELLYNGNQGERNALCLLDSRIISNPNITEINILVQANTDAAADFPEIGIARCVFRTVF